MGSPEVGQRGGKGSRSFWLKTDFVVDCISEPLLAAQVSFRCLNADVSEQELDLIKLSTGFVAQSGTGRAQIVRSNTVQTAFRGPGFHYAPDHLRAETARRDSSLAGLLDNN